MKLGYYTFSVYRDEEAGNYNKPCNTIYQQEGRIIPIKAQLKDKLLKYDWLMDGLPR